LCAEVRARCQWRPVDWEIAHWQVIDRLPLLAVRLVHVEHLLRRREAPAVALIGWRTWFAAMGARVLHAVGRSVLPAWSPWTGLAPPAVGLVVLRQ